MAVTPRKPSPAAKAAYSAAIDVETGGVEAYQVHLVHGQHGMADAQQARDQGVAAGLHLDAVAGVHQHHGHVGGGGAGGHVAGVLLVAGRVGDDEPAARGGEVAVGHVDGDALLALGLQAVHQQRQVGGVPGGAVAAAVTGQGGGLVVEHAAGVVQQAADQGGSCRRPRCRRRAARRQGGHPLRSSPPASSSPWRRPRHGRSGVRRARSCGPRRSPARCRRWSRRRTGRRR